MRGLRGLRMMRGLRGLRALRGSRGLGVLLGLTDWALVLRELWGLRGYWVLGSYGG